MEALLLLTRRHDESSADTPGIPPSQLNRAGTALHGFSIETESVDFCHQDSQGNPNLSLNPRCSATLLRRDACDSRPRHTRTYARILANQASICMEIERLGASRRVLLASLDPANISPRHLSGNSNDIARCIALLFTCCRRNPEPPRKNSRLAKFDSHRR